MDYRKKGNLCLKYAQARIAVPVGIVLWDSKIRGTALGECSGALAGCDELETRQVTGLTGHLWQQ